LGGPKLRDHWEDLGIGGRIGRKELMGLTGFGWLRIEYDGRSL
jgi:hypothetical protein